MKTLKTNRIFAVLMLASLIFSSFNLFAQEKTLRTENDGFQWYELEQNGKHGAQSMSGTTFIPLSRGYTFICYHEMDGGWFSVKKNGGNGACDITGREIVAPGMYDNVSYYNDSGYEYCKVRLNGKTGICDMNGREIIAPRYKTLIFNEIDCVFKYENDSGEFVSTGITVPKSYTSGNASNSSSPSSNTVSPTPQPQQVQPQPIHQPQPMQVWKQCFFCQGSGQCQTCLGTGHTLVYPCQDRCWNCGGTGKCTHCAGQGGHNEIEYH